MKCAWEGCLDSSRFTFIYAELFFRMYSSACVFDLCVWDFLDYLRMNKGREMAGMCVYLWLTESVIVVWQEAAVSDAWLAGQLSTSLLSAMELQEAGWEEEGGGGQMWWFTCLQWCQQAVANTLKRFGEMLHWHRSCSITEEGENSDGAGTDKLYLLFLDSIFPLKRSKHQKWNFKLWDAYTDDYCYNSFYRHLVLFWLFFSDCLEVS